jgi:uncharacterized protein (TIGR03437 family)
VYRPACISTLFSLFALHAQVSVLTYQYDNSRAGANRAEPVLTRANVNSAQFGKLFSYAVDGLMYAQPLYLAGVAIPGKGTRNVVYAVTEHDSVYAFDADGNLGNAPIWHVSFVDASRGVSSVPARDTSCDQIDPEIGITSTPVIDAQSKTIYIVAMTKEVSGGNTAYVHRLHALDVATGAERSGSPVTVQATYPGRGEGGTTLTFVARNYKQRPGLLLVNGVVYAAFSSHCDIGKYHGWVLGYDARSLQQVSVYNSTPDGNQASFWAGGAAPAADSNGNVYVVSGNGTFDAASGGRDLGESFIKLSTAGGRLDAADYFTPLNYDEMNRLDQDTGSAGVVLLGDEAGSAAHPHLLAGAGKEGRLYLLDRDNMGKLSLGSDAGAVQSLPGVIGPLFGNPAYFNERLYLCAIDDRLKAFDVAGARVATPAASQSTVTFGYPGCVPTISANGTAEAIVWVTDITGVLRAYDSGNVGIELYNSNQNQGRDFPGLAVKFAPPMVANGKVFVGTQSALAVYGLLTGGTTGAVGISNAASGDAAAMAPGSIASIYGTGLATSIATAGSFPLPTSLGGATVTVNDIAAPLFYASPTQINFQIPFETAVGSATVTTRAGSVTIPIRGTAPGLFVETGGNAAVLNEDGSVNGAGRPAAAGSVIAAYVTGLGAVSPAVATGAAAPQNPLSRVTTGVTATIGGQSATVQFAGLAPGFAGLYQVNLIVPALAAGSYDLEVAGGNRAVVVVK